MYMYTDIFFFVFETSTDILFKNTKSTKRVVSVSIITNISWIAVHFIRRSNL